MKLTGAAILCESLKREGVEVMFGYPGGAILPFYDELVRYPELRHILVRHEQAAAHAADGYARASGRVGVCVATSGPGATNLVTGICTAHMDSSPVVAITGQVATPFIGKDAFQETDVTGITLPITKHNYLVERVEDLPRVVKESFHIANTGRPGPVLIDVPKDVQNAETTFRYPDAIDLPGYKPTKKGHVSQIRKAAQAIAEAKKPLIIAGHGVLISRAMDELKAFAEKAQIPVITTLLGISCFPNNHVLSVGMMGMHGVAWSNIAVCEADLIIGIGIRFDDRITGRLNGFAPNADIIHIDIDPAEIGKNVRTLVPIVGDVKEVLRQLIKEISPANHSDWIGQIEQWREEHPSLAIRESEELLPQQVIRDIWEETHGDAIAVTDVGQHQMWVAQHWQFNRANMHITSGGLGTMGFALPAAMGVKVARPDEPVWAICGDGGFQMNLQELATLVQDNIAVKIGIINNAYLGMVRQWQELFYERRYSGVHLDNAQLGPDFIKLGEAYGIPSLRVTSRDRVGLAVREAERIAGPVLIEFRVSAEENCYPMIPPGASLAEMVEEPQREKVVVR